MAPARNAVESGGSAGPWQAVGSVAWFLMDGLWLLGAGFEVVLALGVASVAAHLLVLALRVGDPALQAVNAAETCWVGFNVLWLVDDFQEQEWALLLAKALFLAGAALLLAAFVAGRRDGRSVLPRFRRLRTGIES
ncbi:MAG TPA: hypothetical protein VNN10_08335 [Dehalococcoidia bacterium]|nr:hypothetical protein [Dehalococcoidia bacterium]